MKYTNLIILSIMIQSIAYCQEPKISVEETCLFIRQIIENNAESITSTYNGENVDDERTRTLKGVVFSENGMRWTFTYVIHFERTWKKDIDDHKLLEVEQNTSFPIGYPVLIFNKQYFSDFSFYISDNPMNLGNIPSREKMVNNYKFLIVKYKNKSDGSWKEMALCAFSSGVDGINNLKKVIRAFNALKAVYSENTKPVSEDLY